MVLHLQMNCLSGVVTAAGGGAPKPGSPAAAASRRRLRLVTSCSRPRPSPSPPAGHQPPDGGPAARPHGAAKD